MIVSIEEEGVRFRSYLDGAERFMGPETSMEVQAALGSDIALAFDECTPFHVERDYTARSMERTHRWLDRCVSWHARARARRASCSTGSCRAASTRTCARESTAYVAGAGVDGIAIGGSLGPGQGADARGGGLVAARTCPTSRRATCSGIGDVDDLVHAVGAGIDTFDCATPTRLARHGTALVPDPDRPLAARPQPRRATARSREPIDAGCPCPACREHTRGYLHYLVAGERADRQAPAHAAQPDLHGRADARHARGDRGRRARRALAPPVARDIIQRKLLSMS